jgi:hypothetical protein
MTEEEKGWNERRFFRFNLNPADKNMPEPTEPESYLPNPKTNPARYGDEPLETGEKKRETDLDNPGRATPLNPSTEPSASVARQGPPNPRQSSTPMGPAIEPAPPTT